MRTHPRQKPGGRITDPADLPSEKTEYAMRNIASQRRKAFRYSNNIGALVDLVLDAPLPWTKMRHVYRLFRTIDRYGVEVVDQACQRAVEAEYGEVNVVVRMVERALEAAAIETEPVPDNVITGRFARNPEHFAAGKKVTP